MTDPREFAYLGDLAAMSRAEAESLELPRDEAECGECYESECDGKRKCDCECHESKEVRDARHGDFLYDQDRERGL